MRFGVQFKLVRFNYTQRRAGHPRSSPCRFAAIVGYTDFWFLFFWFLESFYCAEDFVPCAEARISSFSGKGRAATR
jgi:hypothetical protein